jgi:hypothetical protein
MMEEYRSPTNDLIDWLTSKLTREGREILGEIEDMGDALVRGSISQEEAEAAEEAVLRRIDHLPHPEGDVLSKVLELKAQGHEVIEQEHAKASADARCFEEMIHRAQGLEQAEGKDSRPDMMLREAVEVLRRRGELT